MQATNVRFRFEDQALSVVFGASQQEVQNVIVGGENRWEYGLFTNWELWWPGFPILVYFKARPLQTAFPCLPSSCHIELHCPNLVSWFTAVSALFFLLEAEDSS